MGIQLIYPLIPMDTQYYLFNQFFLNWVVKIYLEYRRIMDSLMGFGSFLPP